MENAFRLSFLEQLYYYSILSAERPALQDIAIQGLEEGFRSDALVNLAGMTELVNEFDRCRYYTKMLDELNLSYLLDKKISALSLIKSIALRVANNDLDPLDGTEFIFEKVLDQIDLNLSDKVYVYDNIGLQHAYGDYHTIRDLQSSSENWQMLRSNQQLIDDLKIKLKYSLTEWTTNNDIKNLRL